jgi:hypothetical protein
MELSVCTIFPHVDQENLHCFNRPLEYSIQGSHREGFQALLNLQSIPGSDFLLEARPAV